jgi:anti-sigma regulatory factor (Ser/Thr protein kinase)
MRLPASPMAARTARREIAALLPSSDTEEFCGSVALVASELVNNAVVYGSSTARIALEIRQTAAWVELRVENRGERLRIKDIRTRRGNGGRGLAIVDALADSWSLHALSRGGPKVVVRLSRAAPRVLRTDR